ncbi:MAG TPA: hypothetical protein GX742_01630 [Acholeplasmataceae bacterium]|nr:hypothetical protein [Acholeplasmataceae bacterium]
MTNKRKKLIRTTIIVLAILLIGVTYVFAFPYKAANRVNPNNMEFEATYENAEEYGFVDANLLSDKEKLVAENDKLILYLDETTSYFKVEDKLTGEVIESNPSIEDPGRPGGNVADRQFATIEYYYFNESGVRSARNDNYRSSISHLGNPEIAEGYRTYKVKELENGFQIYYQITDTEIDYLYFPLYLDAEIFEEIYSRPSSDSTRRAIMNTYNDIIDPDVGMYRARNYENWTRIQRNNLYTVFYENQEFGEYSRERVIEENASHGYFDQITKFGFDIALQVILTDDGFEIKIINDSITEYSTSKLSEIRLFPHLGTALSHDPITSVENEGYIVLPDGSGAILEFNNGKTTVSDYKKRLYGFDLANLPMSMPESQQDVLLPLYGMVKEDIGFAAIITEGDGMAEINATTSGINSDSYNKVYPGFILRESEFATLGAGWNTYDVYLWSRNRAEYDYTIKYVVLTGDENSYVGIANAYQNYLIDEKGMKKQDSVNSGKVFLEILGSYDTKKFFLGIPYNAMDTLTTFEETEIIVDDLIALGVENMDIIFNGITKEGMNNGLENKVKFDGGLGGKKGFEKLEESLNSKNINIFPIANITTTKGYTRIFDPFKYSSKRISGSLARDFEYHIPTRLPYSETNENHSGDHYVINPLYYETLYNQRNKSYRFENVALFGMGSRVSSSFIKNDELYAQEAILLQEQLLSNVENQNLMLSKPFGFAMPYLHTAVDLPTDTTLYQVLDYSIPLVQLVLSGYVEYTPQSINMASERDIDYKFLKALESGSNLKYTLSYDNSLELLNTEHNIYMSTEYTNWLYIIAKHNNVMESLGLYESNIVDHERLLTNVYKTTYSNGVEIITNYRLTNITVEGELLPSMGYLAKGGNL